MDFGVDLDFLGESYNFFCTIKVLQAASEMAAVQEILQDWPEFRDSLPLVLAEARFAALCKELTARKEPLACEELATVARFSIEVLLL